MGLSEIQSRYVRWTILRTPKGAWVARRKRHIVLTGERIDHGIRDCLIEASEDDLIRQLDAQEAIDADLAAGNTK